MKNKNDLLEDGKCIAIFHARQSKALENKNNNQQKALNQRISSSEEILLQYGKALPEARDNSCKPSSGFGEEKEWSEIVMDARSAVSGPLSFNELLSCSEIEEIIHNHKEIEKDLGWLRSFDRYDFTLAVSAGILSARLIHEGAD